MITLFLDYRKKVLGGGRLRELPQVAQRRTGRAGTETRSSPFRPFILSEQAQRVFGALPRSSRGGRVGGAKHPESRKPRVPQPPLHCPALCSAALSLSLLFHVTRVCRRAPCLLPRRGQGPARFSLCPVLFASPGSD